MPKVSVVIPIYNMEKYLERSIQSLLKQSLQDIEIILVNDGSSDSSLEICKRYESIDKRVKVINKSNAGVSSARNAGLDIATGDYIGFIDPDDWVEIDMYEGLYNTIVDINADIVMCNFVIDNNTVAQPIKIPTEEEILNRQDIVEWLIPNMIGPKDLNSNRTTIMGSVCRLLVKRELIFDKQIYFPLGIALMEDLIWCVELFANTDKIAIDTNFYYHYMKNENSAVTGYKQNLSEIHNKVFCKLEELISQYSIEKYCEESLRLRYVNMTISNILNELHKRNPKREIDKVRNISKWCKDSQVKDVLVGINTKNYTLRKKITLWALQRGLTGYLYVYYSILRRLADKECV